MKKSFLLITLCLGLILSACSSPAPATTEAAPAPTNTVAPPTATLAPTETPTEIPPTNTPEPTATPAPAAQPISAANAANLAYAGLEETPRAARLVDPYFLKFTPDGQNIVISTEFGTDILKTDGLEYVASFPGFSPVDLLADGRVYGKQNGELALLDVVAQTVESLDFKEPVPGTFGLSAQGNKLAYVADDKTIQVVDLVSGSATPLTVKSTEAVEKLFFSGDESLLVAWWNLDWPEGYYETYDLAANKLLHTQKLDQVSPVLKSDGETVMFMSLDGQAVGYTLATNKQVVAMGTMLQEGSTCPGPDVCTWVQSWMRGFYPSAGPDNIIGIYHTEVRVGNNQDFDTQDVYVEAIPLRISSNQPLARIKFDTELLTMAVAADETLLVAATTDGKLSLREVAGGTVVAESDRYTSGTNTIISPDGSLLAWASLNDVVVYNLLTGEIVLQKPHPATAPVLKVTGIDFIGNEGLVVALELRGPDLALPYPFWKADIWDIGAGNVTQSLDGVRECNVQDEGEYIKCSLTGQFVTWTATRIFSIADANAVLFNDNVGDTFMVSSPLADSYAQCKSGSNSISVKAGAAPTVRLSFPCQPFFYSPDGKSLYLQDGTVVDIASGEVALTLAVSESGQLFTIPETLTLSEYTPPPVYFGSDFLVVNNRIFDTTSGTLLTELSGPTSVHGVALSEDGLSLIVLTNRGLERWQVLQ